MMPKRQFQVQDRWKNARKNYPERKNDDGGPVTSKGSYVRRMCQTARCCVCSEHFYIKNVLQPTHTRIPLVLHCGHCACEICVRSKIPEGQINCNTCNFISQYEGNTLIRRQFPINLYLLGDFTFKSPKQFREKNVNFLAPKSKVTNTNRKGVACGECGNCTLFVCRECNSPFCDDCFARAHMAAKTFKSHQKVPFDTPFKAEISHCLSHNDYKLDMFCRTCNSSICVQCSLTVHREHSLNSMADEIMEVKPKLQEAAVAAVLVRERLCQSLQEAEKFRDETSKSDDVVAKFEQEVASHVLQAMGLLQLQFRNIMLQLADVREQRKTSADLVVNQITSHLESVEDFLEQMNYVNENNPSNVPELGNLLKNLTNAAQLPQYFVPRETTEEDIKIIHNSELTNQLQAVVQIFISNCGSAALLAENDLPDGYQVKPISLSDRDESDKSESSEFINYSKQKVNVSVPDSASKLREVNFIDRTSSQVTSSKSSENLSPGSLQEFSRGSSQDSLLTFLKEKDRDASDSPMECSSSSSSISHYPLLPLPQIQDLRRGSTLEVFISHATDPENFYARPVSSDVDNLALAYTSYARSAPPVKDIQIKGRYLARFASDNKWYRAQVKKICNELDPNNEELYEAFFIDYGNIDKVPKSDFRNIPSHYMNLPRECFKCGLDVKPIGGKWTRNALEKLKDMVNFKPLKMEVLEVTTDQLIVDLCIIATEDGEASASVADYLLLIQEACMKKKTHPVPMAPSPYDTYLKDMLDLVIYSTHEVSISAVESPSSFYISRVTQQSYLHILMKKINDHYNGLAANKSLIYNPVPNMACVARFSKDKTWYRACVVNVRSRNVEVFYIDYGNKEVIPFTELRVISNEFLTLPQQATLCSLKHVVPPNMESSWSKEATEQIKRLEMEGRSIKVYIEDIQDDKLEVTLYDVREDKDICINALLCKMNLAESTGHSSLIAEYMKNDADRQMVCKERSIEDVRNKKMRYELDSDDDDEVETLEQEIFEIPRQDPCLQKRIAVDVLCIESPSCIFVSMPTMQTQIQKLQYEMNEFYKSSSIIKESDWTPEVGKRFAVKDDYDRWYRAIVLESSEDGRYKVILKDIGKIAWVDGDSILPLGPRFLTVPDGSVRCSLADIIPAGGSSARNKPTWPTLACEKLKDFTAENRGKLFISKKGEVNKNERCLPVLLWAKKVFMDPLEASEERWLTANQFLLDGGLALPDRSGSAREEEIITEEDLIVLDFRQGLLNDVALDFRTDVEETVQPERNMESPSELVTYSENLDWPPPQPFPESHFSAIITYVDESAYLYVHDAQKSGENISMMSSGLTDRYMNSRARPHDQYWFPGQRCIGLYHGDQRWYRGKVLEVNEDNKISVNFVDYGNTEECRAADLRKNIYFTHIPIQARKCRLAGIRPPSVDGKWTTEQLDEIHHTLVSRSCSVKILRWPQDKDDVYEIIVEMPEEIEPDIRKTLAERNLVKYNPAPVVRDDDHVSDDDVIVLDDAVSEKSGVICLSEKDKSEVESINSAKECGELIAPTSNKEESIDSSEKTAIRIPKKMSVSENWGASGEVGQNDKVCDLSTQDNDSKKLISSPRVALLRFLSLHLSQKVLEYKQQKIPEEDHWTVQITSLLSETQVAFQILDVFGNVQWRENRKKFETMENEINVRANYMPVLKDVSAGDACLASEDSKKWCRGKVITVHENIADVELVDGLQRLQIPLVQIRKITDKWMEVPIQVFVGKLSEVILGPEKIKSDVCKRLSKALFDVPLELSVVKRDPLTVELRNGGNLAYQSLIDEELLCLATDFI